MDRLWAERMKWPPIVCGVAAGVLLALAVPVALLAGKVGLVVAAVLIIAAMAAGGTGAWLYSKAQKPDRESVEALVVLEVAKQSIDEGRTFMTNEHYLELVDRGIIG